MILALSTWLEIESRLHRSRAVVIPIGSNVQHGPTGLLGTDWPCPEIIAHEAHRRGGDILVATTFNIADGRMGSDPLLVSPDKGAELTAGAAAVLLRDCAEFCMEPFLVEKPGSP